MVDKTGVVPTRSRSKPPSSDEIFLGYMDAIRATDLHVSARFAVLGWKLPVKYPDFRPRHPGRVVGAAMYGRENRTWKESIRDAAAFCRETGRKEYRRRAESSTNAGLTRSFCITAAGLQKHE